MAQAFNLAIQPTLKTKDTKIIAGIAAFVENSDIMQKELEKRALRAAKEVAPERTGGLKKAIEITNSNPLGYTLGVSENITEGVNATQRVDKYKEYRTATYFVSDKGKPKELRERAIPKPSMYTSGTGSKFFEVVKKPEKQYLKEMQAYARKVAAEKKRVAEATAFFNRKRLITKTKVTLFISGESYNPYMDGGSKVRANMQEFGYPYRTKKWGPYKPNPGPPKGAAGLGYLRYGQVLAAKSLTKDYITYDVAVTDAEVVNYEKTIENEMVKAYTIILAKFLRKQKLPLYYKGIDTLKQKAPIPERAKAYGNVTNLNLDIDLAFPRNPYSNLESGRRLANISQSVTGRDFAIGSYFLIEDPLPF